MVGRIKDDQLGIEVADELLGLADCLVHAGENVACWIVLSDQR